MSYRATQSKNVYKTQFGMYRVRVKRNGVTISKNFTRYRDAVNHRNNLTQAN